MAIFEKCVISIQTSNGLFMIMNFPGTKTGKLLAEIEFANESKRH